MAILLPCPKCGKRVNLQNEYAGKKWKCAGCKAKIRVPCREAPAVLGKILQNHTLDDVSVEDPPLEEVIAEMFSLANEESEAEGEKEIEESRR